MHYTSCGFAFLNSWNQLATTSGSSECMGDDMTNIEIGLALIGASFGIVSTGFVFAWSCNELPRLHYRDFLSGLTKNGSYLSGSSPD